MKQKSALFLALAIVAGACTKQADTAKPDDGKAACTEEAKTCPDGSSVSRSGPDCEFPACPGEGQEGTVEENADGGAEATPAEDKPAADAKAPAEGE
jgi:hypothetical protein